MIAVHTIAVVLSSLTSHVFVTVLDKEHFSPNKKISFNTSQKIDTSKPSKIPILIKSTGSQEDEVGITNPDTILPTSTSGTHNKQYSLQTSQLAADDLTSNKKTDAVMESSVATNELSSSLHINGGKSIDSGFVDEKNKQKADTRSLPFTPTTREVTNGEDESSHIEAKCFTPLEEVVDQGITASRCSIDSTTTSTSLEEMVGDECSSSGREYVKMSSEPLDQSILAQLHRPRSACDNYNIHHFADDQQMKRHESLPWLDSSPTLLASKINLLHNEKVPI